MPDWKRIAKKQNKAWDAMYDPMEIADKHREMEQKTLKQKVKSFLLELLKEDEKFREEVIKLLKH